MRAVITGERQKIKEEQDVKGGRAYTGLLRDSLRG